MPITLAACLVAIVGLAAEQQAEEAAEQPATQVAADSAAKDADAFDASTLRPAHLIAAMPPAVDGVIVHRPEFVDRFTAFGPPGAEPHAVIETFAVQGYDAPADDTGEPIPFIESITDAGFLLHAQGGSHFRPSEDIGFGDARSRHVWVTERPMRTLIDDLRARAGDADGGVTRVERGGVEHFRTTNTIDLWSREITEPLYIVFLGERVLITAESLEDAAAIRDAMLAGADAMPKRWAAVAGDVDFDAPVVVLRRFIPSDRHHWVDPPMTRDEPTGHALALTVRSAGDTVEMRLVVRSPDWNRWIGFFLLDGQFFKPQPAEPGVYVGLASLRYTEDDDHLLLTF
jgi:hypothetical protein